MGDRRPLSQGLLELLILGLVRSDPAYAADIIDRLDEAGMPTKEGTLYPLLSKMSRERLLRHAWQESAAGPPRKYYRLTPAGRARLEELQAEWAQMAHAVEALAGTR